MQTPEQYFLQGCPAEAPDSALEAVASGWEWFSLPHLLLSSRHGQTNTLVRIVGADRLPGQTIGAIDTHALLSVSSDELIDRFLNETHQRIVAEEGEPDQDVRTAPDLNDEDDLASEPLAEIYLKQGLRDRAIATYRKLSLLNPEKSVYFAEIIRKIETNN